MRIGSAFAGCRGAWVPWQVTHRARAPVTSRKVPSPPRAPCSGSSVTLACCSVLSYICCRSRAEIAHASSGGGERDSCACRLRLAPRHAVKPLRLVRTCSMFQDSAAHRCLGSIQAHGKQKRSATHHSAKDSRKTELKTVVLHFPLIW